MYMDDSITIARAANGGFVIICKEKEKEKAKTLDMPGYKEMPYVVRNINEAMKIIKSKLERYSNEAEDIVEHEGMIKNAYQ